MKADLSVKKYFTTIIVIFLSSFCFAETKIVTTIFPIYDWVREITGSEQKNAEITLLIKNGVDLHSYQPSIKDIAKISTADIFIYVGGESDEWVQDVLKNVESSSLKTICLMEALGNRAKAEESVEGMQTEEDEEIEYDEHIWLSLQNAELLCKEICQKLCQADSINERIYKENYSSYAKKLQKLDSEYESAVQNAGTNTLLFGDRFPFRYLTDDYGLKYYAAFKGCSAESEASFETIVFLSRKLDELGLKSVCQTESSNGKIARTIIQSSNNKNAKVLTLDSMQSTTTGDIKKGATYLGVMQKNLEVLKEALK